MKHSQLIALVSDNFTTVKVQSPTNWNEQASQKEYTYKVLLSDKIEVGDFVVVKVPSGDFKVCLVSHVDKTPDLKLYTNVDLKWIVQKVDTTRFDRITEYESKFEQVLVLAERTTQKKRLLAELEENFPEGSEGRTLLDELKKEFTNLLSKE